MGEFILKGHISYAAKKRYKWIAELGKNTCDECAGLDGREFDEGDVPFWPHPNCRCKVEEMSVVDEVESEMNEYKEIISQLELDLKEIQGDLSLLKEQIGNLKNEAKSEAQELIRQLERLEYELYKLMDSLERQTRDTMGRRVIEKIQEEIERIKNRIKEYADEYKGLNAKLSAEKLIVDKGVDIFSRLAPDAAALWTIASSKFQRGLDYIEKNGKIVEKVSDLRDKKLEEKIRKKLDSQIHKDEARGVVFHSKSSLANMISSSQEFKQIISNNQEKLKNGETIPKVSTFLNWLPNNFLSIHGCDITNIRIENGNLHATVIDTIDYNSGEPWVILPNDLQKGGSLENYYIIIDIAEPIFHFFK